MKELFNLLKPGERKILSVLALVFVIALLVYFSFVRGAKTAYLRSLDSLSAGQKNFEAIQLKRTQKKIELVKWNDALIDLDEINSQYFYKQPTVSQRLRRDLERIFERTNIQHSMKLSYSYVESNKEISQENATFEISGPYAEIKKFIYVVENFPRFLLLEKIEFQKIDARSGRLSLRLTLAGYYD